MEELIEKIYDFAKENLSQKRFEHSVRVAETASFMAGLYGLSREKAYLAGIAHDISKEIGGEAMLEAARRDGLPIRDFEMEKLDLLHGRAAAVKLREDFGIEDKDILDAVAFHTFGNPGVSDLGKIIFVADKIEPCRPQSTDEYRKRLFEMPLEMTTYSVVKENCEYLEARGKTPAPVSLEFLAELREELHSGLGGNL